VFLLILLGAVILQARHFQRQVEAGEVPWQSLEDDFSRSSVMAVRGATREASNTSKTLVFVGPSSLRCWLPAPDETAGIASAATGIPVKVLEMCSNKQSYAFTAALVDQFGPDFDGWFVIGVGMHSIGRESVAEDRNYHSRETRVLGFQSEVLKQESAWMGYPQEASTGVDVWDHRAFFYQSKLGFDRPASSKVVYHSYFPSQPIATDVGTAGLSPLNRDMLDRHLALLGRMAERIRKGGRARMAIVETPWVDTFIPSMQTPGWQQDEAIYQKAIADWSAANDVPWINAPNHFQATLEDFSDSRHVGSTGPRKLFLETVARELIIR